MPIERLPEPTVFEKLDEDNQTQKALGLLAVGQRPHTLYRAAYPGYFDNFTRDSLVAMSYLSADVVATSVQLQFSKSHQGTKPDPLTGEEPGKIHHQMTDSLEGVEINGLSSKYNACDTTALYLSRIACLAESGVDEPLDEYQESVDNAVEYIERHVSSANRPKWKTALEREIMRNMPHVSKHLAPWTLAAKYPNYPYKVVKDKSAKSTDMPAR